MKINMNMTMKTMSALIALLLCVGCQSITSIIDEISGANDVNVSALVIGVENGYAGKCTGSLRDIETMESVLTKAKVKNVIYLADAAATLDNVTNAMLRVLQSDVAIIFYSGHGGWRNAIDSDELDGKDEFLCLYDKPLVDNEIWKLLQTSNGRVVTIFDCCHSETMFRTSMTFSQYDDSKQPNLMKATGKQVNLLCMSACADNKYSYGTNNGGQFTQSINFNYRPYLTYAQLWKWVVNDPYLIDRETVKKTVIGQNFENMRAFK